MCCVCFCFELVTTITMWLFYVYRGIERPVPEMQRIESASRDEYRMTDVRGLRVRPRAGFDDTDRPIHRCSFHLDNGNAVHRFQSKTLSFQIRIDHRIAGADCQVDLI